MTAEIRYTDDIKSNLAKLMASEDLQVVHQVIETAAFDTKNRILHLPIWKGVSDDLYNMLISHEIGHALYTPEGYGDPKEYPAFSEIPSSYINIVEDARIERMVKSKYPGSVRAFLNGYKEIMKMPGFEIKDVNSLNLIDRINLFYKGGMMMGIIFNEDEKVLLEKVGECSTFDEVIEISREIYEYSKEFEENPEQNPEDNSSVTISMGDDSSDSDDLYDKPSMGDNSPSMSEESSESSEETSESSEETSESGEESSESGEESSDSDSKKELGNGKGSESDEQNEPTTDNTTREVGAGKETSDKYSELTGKSKNLDSVTNELFNNTIKNIETEKNERFVPVVARMPKFNVEDYVVSSKITNGIIDKFYSPVERNETNKFAPDFSERKAKIIANMESYISENRKVVNYLAKEFEMKKAAYAHRNSSISKTGKLNINKVAKYQVNEDIFLRKTTVKNAKSHGLIMLIDWSGSMAGCIKDAIHQVVNTVMFAKRVGIPFEVYSFGAQGSTFNHSEIRQTFEEFGIEQKTFENYDRTPQKEKIGELFLGREKLRQYITSDMNQTEYKNAIANLLTLADALSDNNYGSWGQYPHAESLGGTPLNSCLLKVGKLIERFKAKNNVQKVNLAIMTDGASSKIDGVFTQFDSNSTGKVYAISNYRYTIKDGYNSYEIDSTENIKETNSLLEMLRKKYDINVIGFYIAANSRDLKYAVANYVDVQKNLRGYYSRWIPSDVWAERRKEYNKNKFLEATVSGFTKYFIIPGKRSGEVKEMSTDMSKAQLKTAFVKNLNKNTESRIVLSKFISLIA